MQTTLECLSCFIQQALTTASRLDLSREASEHAARAVLRYMADADWSLPPPVLAHEAYPLIEQHTDRSAELYAATRYQQNRRALELLPRLQRQVQAADDPFRTAVKLTLAGNIIDLGVAGGALDQDLDATVSRVMSSEPATDHVEQLRRRVDGAARILYLADNAGEIVLDRLLLDQLPPAASVTLAVRGGPVINDVVRDDLAQVGIQPGPRLAIIDSGVALPGTWLPLCSAELRRAFDQADVIISKGQGNYETLHHHQRYPLFFLFMVKCAVVSRFMGLELGSPVVIDSQFISAKEEQIIDKR